MKNPLAFQTRLASCAVPGSSALAAGRYLFILLLAAAGVLTNLAQANSCAPAPAGLVGSWSAEGNATDSSGAHPGTFPFGSAFAPGEVGQAFDFDGSFRRVSIPESSAFHLTNAMTLEAWVYPRAYGGFITFRGDNRGGLDTWVLDAYETGFVKFQIDDEANNYQSVRAPLALNQWQHVAATWERASGDMKIYLNGVLIQQTNTPIVPIGVLDAAQDPAVGIGNHGGTFHQFPFNGLIDELAIFNRALTAAEILAIYNAGSAGKCPATNPPPVSCVTPPVTLVGWWRAEGNGADAVGTNTGLPQGGLGFANGIVGTAFQFDGVDDRLIVPNAPALNFGPGEDFSIEGWIQPLSSDTPFGVMTIIGKRLTPDFVSSVGYELYLQDGKLACQLGTAPISLLNFGNFAAPGPDLRDGGTHHVAVTVTRNSTNGARLYVDGQLVHTFDPTPYAGDMTTTEPLRLGENSLAGHPTYFKGLMDEFGIYRRALSPPEILAIYNAGSAGKCPAPPPSTNCVSAPAGLLGWWRGEGNAVDVTGNEHGIITTQFVGNVTFSPGKVGTAFDFSGSDFVELEPLALTSFTIECWLNQRTRVPVTPNSSWGCFIISDEVCGVRDDWHLGLLNGGQLLFHIGDGSGGVDYQFPSDGVIPLNTYVHVAVTRSTVTGKIELYINGVLDRTFTAPHNRVVGMANPDCDIYPNTIGIGNIRRHAALGIANNFDGLIDEPAIYNRALSATEIAAIYNADSAGKCEATNPPPVCVPAPAGLVAWWPGNDSATELVHGNHGMLNSGGAYTNAIVGAGFSLDGLDDRVVVADAPVLNFGSNQDLSIECWIKAYPNSNPSNVRAIVDKRNAAENYRGYTLFLWDGFLAFQLSEISVGVNYFSSGADLRDGVFHHVAVTVDRDSATGGRLYVDGQVIYTFDPTGVRGDLSNSDVLRIGQHAAPGDLSSFPGVIDDVAIYNRALTSNEIAGVFNAGSAGKCPPTNSPFNPGDGLVAHYPFSGDASDVSGNGNHGVPSNAVLATDRFGSPNAAFSFNGQNAAVTVTDNPALRSLTSNYTFNAWVRFGSNPQIDAAILMKSAGAGNQRKWTFWRHVQAPPYGLGLLLNRVPGGLFQWNNDYPFTINQWFMVTFSASATSTLIAVDGQVVSAQSGNLVLPDTTGLAMSIGGAEPGGPQWFQGLLDDIRIYNRTFSSNDIAQLYQLESGQAPPDVAVIPVITSFNPTVATAGSSVTISGTNFSSVAAGNIVYFGAVRAVVTAASSNSLTVTVPIGATHAPITVTVDGLTAAARTAFTPTFAGGAAISTASFSPRVNLGTGDGPTGTAIADFDGDGKPDIAVTDDYGHTLSLYRNISVAGTLDASSFAPRVVLPASPADYSPYMLVTGDVDGDGKLDLITTDIGGNTVSVYRNQAVPGSLSSNSFAPFVSFTVGTGPRTVALVDLDADGRPEIVTANYDGSTVSVLRNTGVTGQISPSSFAPRFDLPAGAGAHGLAVTDLDGDGRPDLATANAVGASLSLFRNVGNGPIASNSFASVVTIPAPGNAHFVRAADLDADGRAELLLTSYLGQTLTVYRNQADSGVLNSNSFAAGVTLALAGRGHTISLGDLNGDARPDIAVDTEIGDSIALFQNQSAPGSFTSASLATRVDLAAGWNAWGSSVGDLDGDGRPDIIFGNTYDDTLSLYRNQTTLSNPPVSCAPTPPGLVASWRAEGNAVDSVSGIAGSLENVTFTAGEVGQGFYFNGSSQIKIPASANLDVGTSSGLTLETWLRPGHFTLYEPQFVFEWNNLAGGFGAQLLLSTDHGVYGDGFGNVMVNLVDTLGNSHAMFTASDVMVTNALQHVAFTYDKASGFAVIYVNGFALVSTNLGSFTPQTSYDLYLGNRPAGPFAGSYFNGVLDEPSIYNRALSVSEIQAIYNAGSAGKCPPAAAAPSISQQPQSITVAANANAQFDVAATGVPAPTYQWFFGAAAQAGQTNATLFLNNVMPGQAGDYFVIVANPSGSVTSAVATLGVLTFPPTITSQPQDQSVYAGKTVTFYVPATGTAPVRYQWWHDGTQLAPTTLTLTLPNVQSNHAGFYQVIVSNDYGSVTSRLAQLTIVPPPPCAPAPDGVIAWWPGQSNLWDVVGGFDGLLSAGAPPANQLYTTGKVGAAINFTSQQGIMATTGGGLNVNTNSGLTIEGWIRPATSGPLPVAEWNDGKTVGAGLLVSITGPGVIEATLTDSNVPVRTVTFRSPNFTITNLLWQHVALTYDKSAGLATILVNGNAVVQTNIGTMTPNTSGNVYLGYRPAGTYSGSRFRGALDEITLYNRALSTAELQSIIAADETGKCPPPPPTCIKPPADIAAWWRGESNTVDSVAGNDAIRIPTNFPVTQFYQAGQVGAAFSLQSLRSLAVPRSEGLDVGTGSGLTVEAWIYPAVLGPMPIVEWTDTNTYGANLWLSFSRGPTVLEANLIDNAGGFHLIRSPVNTIRSATWQHVAVTYDKTTGVAALYSDGNLVTTTNLGFFTPRTHTELQIGFHPRSTGFTGDGAPPTSDYRFNGAIDELAIYRRALSAAEIRNVARVRPGKCLELPPTISRHPQEQVALEGGVARFEIGVGGTAPFQYQWLFAGNAIAGGTNSFLALAGVAPADTGFYSVLVSNLFGSVTSRVAALTVLPANQCLPTPFGAVAFWRGESNTVDELGSHPAQWGTNTQAAYTVTTQSGGGKVATAFKFTGQNHLLVPTNSNLDVGAGGGFTIEGWIKPDSLSGTQPVWDWNDGRENIGVGLMLGRTGPGMLEVTLTDTNVTSTQLRVVTLTTPNFTLGSITNQLPAWSHVALTFDKATGKLNLFVNGNLVGERTIGLVPGGVSSGIANKLFSPVTTGNLHFGWRRSGNLSGNRFRGAMDEMTVYYRALTPLELQAIYVVGANGKCPPAPACQPLASGIVSWWRGESNVLDSVDGNHGSNNPATLYTNGIVGSGFRITSGRYVQIPAKPELHVGAGAGFTFETWFRRDNLNSYTIAAWNSGTSTQSVSFGSSPTRGPDYFEANLVDTLGISRVLSFYTYAPPISGGLIPVGKWNHLALTYEKLSGNAILFLNGSPVVVTNLGNFTPRTTGNLYLGYRPPGNYPGSGITLSGALDETALYNRALSSGEITANYRNVANRCMMPPVIVQHPASVRVNPGSDVTFQVIAEGNPLLRYQWGVDRSRGAPNFPLPGQTNSMLVLTNVQFKDSSSYWVQVTNAFGSAVSSNINLIVNSPPNAFNQSLTTAEETPRSFVLLASDANQDPLLFTVLTQPTNGTLSATSSNWVYTPAPNYHGPDSFTFKVSDGLLDSAPATVSITVTPVNDPPTAASQFVATDEDTPLPITLGAADADGDALTFLIAPPAHGTLSGTAPNVIYTPHANFFGDDLFTFTVRDGGNAVSELAVVSITVRPVNDAPVARIVVAPLDELPGVTNLVVLAPAGCDATVRLDASESTDVENDALTYAWVAGTNVLSHAMIVTNRFKPGTHEFTLVVSDGTNVTTATVTVEIITPSEAVDFLKTLVEESITERRDRTALLAWLRGAGEAFERGHVELGVNFLERFKRRVQERIAPRDAELAAALRETATAIIEAAPDCDPCERLGRPKHKRRHDDRDNDRGRDGRRSESPPSGSEPSEVPSPRSR